MNNALEMFGTGSAGYQDIILFRPESLLDVQVDADVTFPSDDVDDDGIPFMDPTIYVRMPASASTQGEVDGYSFYFYRDYAIMNREDPGDNGFDFDEGDISPPLPTGQPCHVTFKVTGTNPVRLEATVKRPDGSVAITFTRTDSTTKRFSSAGRVGLSCEDGDGVRWDNVVVSPNP